MNEAEMPPFGTKALEGWRPHLTAQGETSTMMDDAPPTDLFKGDSASALPVGRA
jgi:hypothetical protein